MTLDSAVPIGWLSLCAGAFNKGNALIEDATWRLLGQPHRLEFSSFVPLPAERLPEIDRLPALILPGATLLDSAEHPIASMLAQVRCPKLAVGVAFCTQTPEDCSLELAAAIEQPIGSRDPLTHAMLRSAGLESELVGCSTLHIGAAQRWHHRDGPIVFSLGRGEQEPLERCVIEATRHHDVTVIQHVPALQPPFDCPWPAQWIDLESAGQLQKIYCEASLVVTGRVHGALPAIAMGVPVLFFGAHRDSRSSLIDHLGVEQLPPDPNLILRRIESIRNSGMTQAEPLDRAAALRASMRSFLDRHWGRGPVTLDAAAS